jgi:5-methylcytosine-specific restriction endonuclease McrA
VGPIPVATARALASDSILSAVVTKGADVARITRIGRTIPAAVRTALEARDPECAIGGCNVRDHLEIDHIVSLAEGGPTSLDNLARLCRWHHGLKTHRGYRLLGPPGARELIAAEYQQALLRT